MTVKELESRRKQNMHQNIYPPSKNTSSSDGFFPKLCKNKNFDYSFKSDVKLWKKSQLGMSKHLEKNKVLLIHCFFTTHQKTGERPEQLKSGFDDNLISERR